MSKLKPIRRAVAVSSLGIASLFSFALLSQSLPAPVTLQAEIAAPKGVRKPALPRDGGDASNVVVWLLPMNGKTIAAVAPARPSPQIEQRNKSFDPHIVVVQMGTSVQFPNRDPFLHNVFSLFDGKRFDLGFYEAGSSKTVHFDRAGVSFLFCNIHPEMSAAVVSVETPYFGISNRAGKISIPNVPDGGYQLNVWYERSLPEDLKKASRVVTISESARSLDPIQIIENPSFTPEHKNKYGQDYIPPANTSPTYGHP